jgi:hypothetical protein
LPKPKLTAKELMKPAAVDEDEEAIAAAMKKHQIPGTGSGPERTRKLVLKLLADSRRGGGRPVKWTDEARTALRWYVDGEIRASDGKETVDSMCEALIRDPFWQQYCKGKTGDALRKQYDNAALADVKQFAADNLRMIVERGITGKAAKRALDPKSTKED